MTPNGNERPIDDMILGVDELAQLNFETELRTVSLVDYQTKRLLYFPVRADSKHKALYVFSRLPQQDVEDFISALHDDRISGEFIQIWQVAEAEIRKAIATPGVTVYLDLPTHVSRYVEETQIRHN